MKCKEIISIIFLLLSFVYVCKTICVPIKLEKIFYHMNKDKDFDWGKFVLYFDSMPEVSMHTVKHTNEITEYTFLFSNIDDTAVISEITTLQSTRYPYGMSVQIGKGIEKQLQLSFTVNERDVGFVRQEYIAITGQEVVAFNFYNKQILETLKKSNEKPILQLAYNNYKPIVCIDPGHGGKDPGAIGQQGVCEKDIALSIGRYVQNQLKKNDIPVIFTRKDDTFVSLNERIVCAEKNSADLFVSIHVNASKKKNVSGIETYCCNPSFFSTVHATVSVDDFNMITSHEKNIFKHSSLLAHSIHNSVCKFVKEKNNYFVNRKVKHGAAQVLYKTSIPSLLIEVGFISHKEEEILLTSRDYQKSLAKGIAFGIMKFIMS